MVTMITIDCFDFVVFAVDCVVSRSVTQPFKGRFEDLCLKLQRNLNV